jgi:hypothetical protein
MIVDLDSTTGCVAYDARQPLRQPDWQFSE